MVDSHRRMELFLPQDGVISTWSVSLEPQKYTMMDDNLKAGDYTQPAKQKKVTMWVTDTALLRSCGVLVIATTSRELYFYDISTNVYTCQYRLCGEWVGGVVAMVTAPVFCCPCRYSSGTTVYVLL